MVRYCWEVRGGPSGTQMSELNVCRFKMKSDDENLVTFGTDFDGVELAKALTQPPVLYHHHLHKIK